MIQRIITGAAILLLAAAAHGQEINFNVKINTQKVVNADPRVFQSLEASLTEFLNNQKWTNDVFDTDERINCNIVLTIQEEKGPTAFEADLAIQSSRPVYGSDYETPILNHLDGDVSFTYEQYQPLQFNKNRYDNNLTTVVAFYAYIILGMDYDSFSPLGGEPFFQTAQDILNTVPSNIATGDGGWSTTGRRNRYWLLENLLSPRVRPLRRAMYTYHREGLDMMGQNLDQARAAVALALQDVAKTDQSYPNSMIVQTFVNAKGNEVVEIFKRGTQQEQAQVIQTMSQIDPSNATKYRAIR